MSGRPLIDSAEFARQRSILTGEALVSELVRLHDALADQTGSILFKLSGHIGAQGRPRLLLKMSGRLMLTCQRCLQPLEHKVACEREFVLILPGEPEMDVAEEGDMIDCVPADPQLDVVGLVEEELVLSLPMSAMHIAESCRPAWQVAQATVKASPFSKLAALKRSTQS